ncbi:hypothetical protein ACVDFE_24025 [Lentzea chajnantorensis]
MNTAVANGSAARRGEASGAAADAGPEWTLRLRTGQRSVGRGEVRAVVSADGGRGWTLRLRTGQRPVRTR